MEGRCLDEDRKIALKGSGGAVEEVRREKLAVGWTGGGGASDVDALLLTASHLERLTPCSPPSGTLDADATAETVGGGGARMARIDLTNVGGGGKAFLFLDSS